MSETANRPEAPVAPRQGRGGRLLRWLLVGLNLAVLAFVVLSCASLLGLGGRESDLGERFHSGKRLSDNKVAIVRVSGALVDGLNDFAIRQIDQSAEDKKVKAVVLRIDSPGGTITASDDLHHRLTRLRDGSPARGTTAKPLVASMGSIAASGGYYIAMPARAVFAERSTITGSIGVYASFPNVSKLAEKVGVEMTVVKRGDVKTSGSPFRDMRPEEQELWQSFVDHAYEQFKAVVEEGRPALKGKLEEKVIDEERTVAVEGKEGPGAAKKVRYVRRRADGGIFTARQAQQFGLIDGIGYLDEAVAEAARQAGLGDDYRAVTYQRPASLTDLVLGDVLGQAGERGAGRGSGSVLEPEALAAGLEPRVWYLAPQAEWAGVLRASGRRAP